MSESPKRGWWYGRKKPPRLASAPLTCDGPGELGTPGPVCMSVGGLAFRPTDRKEALMVTIQEANPGVTQ